MEKTGLVNKIVSGKDFCLCLICGGKNTKSSKNSNKVSGVSKQLNVIFILKCLLKLPSSQLEKFLIKYGNPDNWISLCKQCTQLTSQAENLHYQILDTSSKLKGLQNEVIEKIKQPIKIPVAVKSNDNLKMTVWKDIKEIIKNDNLCQPATSPTTGIPTVKAEATNHHPPAHLNLSSEEKLNVQIDIEDHQCCPNCSTKFPTQHINYPDIPILPSTAFIGETHNCLYCSIEYPSISSVFKHMQLDHHIDRLPCLHPGCGATLKNLKQYFKHRKIHKRKETEQLSQLNLTEDNLQKSIESESQENQPIIEKSTVPNQNSLTPENLNDDNLQDNHQSDNHNHDDHLQDNCNEDVDQKYLQDNDNDDIQDNCDDTDWLPSSPPGEVDVKPALNFNQDNCLDNPENCKIEDDHPLSSSDNHKVPKLKKIHKPEVQKCPKCSSKFPSITSTLKHMITFHKMSRLPCLHSGCLQTLKNLKQYFKHRSKHLRPPPPPKPKKPHLPKLKVKGPQLCDICGASFTSSSGLYYHRNCVHGNKKYKRVYSDATCHIFGIILKGCHLKMHVLRKHKDECGEDYNGEFHKCGVMGCKRYFLHKVSLDKHMIKMHDGWDGNGEPPENVKKGTFECNFCGKGFHWKGKLEQHELAHRNNLEGRKPWICDLCGKGFGMRQNLDNHKKYTHKLAKKFQGEEKSGNGNVE